MTNKVEVPQEVINLLKTDYLDSASYGFIHGFLTSLSFTYPLSDFSYWYENHSRDIQNDFRLNLIYYLDSGSFAPSHPEPVQDGCGNSTFDSFFRNAEKLSDQDKLDLFENILNLIYDKFDQKIPGYRKYDNMAFDLSNFLGIKTLTNFLSHFLITLKGDKKWT